MRLDTYINSSRRIEGFVKAHFIKYQGLFQKALQLFEKGHTIVSRIIKKGFSTIPPLSFLFPLMPIGTPLADIGLHLGRTRTMKTGNIGLLLRLCLYFFLTCFRSFRLLEENAFSHYLFYIHNHSNSISSTSSAEANSFNNSTI